MSKTIDENTYIELLDAGNKLCNYCEVNECEKCIVTRLIDDANIEAIESGVIDEY